MGMVQSAYRFVQHFIKDESGQAKEEYPAALGFSMFVFVVALILFMGTQTGFVHVMGNIIGGGLNKMAYNTANQQ
jgi:Na+-driven multidrug efflux pump